jgi:tRNA dimethylallyltransferase
VGRWLTDVRATLADLAAVPRPAVIVGGTGMYFKTLTQGISDIPAVPDEVRERVRAGAEGVPPADLHARLAARDPLTAARLRPTDPQRIVRALEVLEATGQPLAAFQGRREAPILPQGSWRGVFLAPDRQELYRRIDARFEHMMESGAVEEVAALAARDIEPALPAMRAHVVPGLIAWLRGEATREEAVARGKTDTRHYSKRQFTFARHQLAGFRWADSALAAQAILQEALRD